MKKCNKFAYIILILIFLTINTASLFLGTARGGEYITALVFSLILCYILHLKKNYIIKTIEKLNTKKILVLLTVICIVIKAIWIFAMPIKPSGDYATFYSYAVTLSKKFIAESTYISLFPHIFGYSHFLSIFIKIFGESYYTATVLNIVCTVLTGLMLYKIGEQITKSKTSGIICYILWIICPSQTIYNNLVLSEPYYTMMIILFIYLVCIINEKVVFEKKNLMKLCLLGIISGIVLSIINSCRPIAIILIIAIVIWLFILRANEHKLKFIKNWCAFLIPMVLTYVIGCFLWNMYISLRLNETPASIPGFTIAVGLNQNSCGIWNPKDSELLNSYIEINGATPQWIQEQMFKEAKKRLLSGEIDFDFLLKNKTINFLGSDDAAVTYNGNIIRDPYHIKMICNIFYYFITILSICGGIYVFKEKTSSICSILILYSIGLILAQLLVEVALRYHYSLIPILILMSSYFICKSNKKNSKME